KLGPLGFVQNRANPPGLSKTFIAAALEPDNREGTGFPFCDALEPNLPRPTLANIWAVEVLTLLGNAIGHMVQEIWPKSVVMVESVVDWFLAVDDRIRRQR